ncbi:hypothetical protein [Parabacteroides sp. PF5-6]|uniref:hypothetical protein n=1 Tax=Parabacteroides sp. PF5-6 TaxID=1742403 RepID=UPI0024075E20|nr:hypothetical protein [Parabacteroides sp. PF5-6]MDF9829808.1 hypothetical protein [Parabacteroides sp. PF5-6]
MKNVIYLFIAVFMVACGGTSTNNTYEKTITGYLLKGSDTKENLNFKVIELNEHGTVTVADSIAYLTDEFRKDKELVIKRIELAKKMSETLLAKAKKQSDIDKYNTDIVEISNSIDSLRNLTPDNLRGYDSRNANDVLSVIVRCKYSLVPPGRTAVEETFDFYLSPDGSKCYGKTRAK